MRIGQHQCVVTLCIMSCGFNSLLLVMCLVCSPTSFGSVNNLDCVLASNFRQHVNS